MDDRPRTTVNSPQLKAFCFCVINKKFQLIVSFCGLSSVVRGLKNYAIGGWKGESGKFSLNSALYSVKQLEVERTNC